MELRVHRVLLVPKDRKVLKEAVAVLLLLCLQSFCLLWAVHLLIRWRVPLSLAIVLSLARRDPFCWWATLKVDLTAMPFLITQTTLCAVNIFPLPMAVMAGVAKACFQTLMC